MRDDGFESPWSVVLVPMAGCAWAHGTLRPRSTLLGGERVLSMFCSPIELADLLHRIIATTGPVT